MTTITNNKLTDERPDDEGLELLITIRREIAERHASEGRMEQCAVHTLILNALLELQERRKADSAEPFGFVTKRCAEHMHDDDRDENNWMWSISAVVIGCNPKLKHEVPVYLHPDSSSKEEA
ncbi:hypothetical protein QDE56_004605 [Salmonella enterica]|nr:hypothetical protein [Salmonella enterica]EKS0405241.1 hypothetical protein [Salmonella enterica]EKS9904823.1 hypothetical protein [Salmonella enterica]EMB3195183.1 hypothetical protein [Salmonella enterica]